MIALHDNATARLMRMASSFWTPKIVCRLLVLFLKYSKNNDHDDDDDVLNSDGSLYLCWLSQRRQQVVAPLFNSIAWRPINHEEKQRARTLVVIVH